MFATRYKAINTFLKRLIPNTTLIRLILLYNFNFETEIHEALLIKNT